MSPTRKGILYHTHTLWLFTKNDIKTAVLPQGVFALGVALSSSESPSRNITNLLPRIPLTLLWSWLQLLCFNISNQRFPASVLEDKINKPWRPLAAGRLSVDEARGWLGVAIYVNVFFSVLLSCLPQWFGGASASVFPATAACLVATWCYNEISPSFCGAAVQKNLDNAVLLGCLGWGSCVVLMGGNEGAEIPVGWLIMTSAVIATTIHAQDMEDVEGDMARNRKTIPLVYGEGWARWSLAFWVLVWSVLCPAYWSASQFIVWLFPCAMGLTIAVLTMTCWDRTADKLVWNLWCLWMCMLYVLPIFG